MNDYLFYLNNLRWYYVVVGCSLNTD